ncbi:MAG TPA: DUF4652 domain-containing protein [Clostridiales bacterium]|nr:DUF4652 domain-containing protein [Clostridiales bacterium]
MIARVKKKSCIWTIVAVILVLLLAWVGLTKSRYRTQTHDTNNGANFDGKSQSNILSENPINLTDNLQNHKLVVKMIDGEYYDDEEPGPFMGPNWVGKFAVELINVKGNVISEFDLNKSFNEAKLRFGSTFEIEFDDYNDDGNLDFTIGQYASSNGRDYKIFTIREDKKIAELPIKDYPTLFISNTTGYYSTRLTKVDKTTFKKEYYDNSESKCFEDVFQWTGKEFVWINKREANGAYVDHVATFDNGGKILYKKNYGNTEIIIENEKKETVLNDNSPSYPIVQQDRKNIAYISPLEWEQIGQIYVYDPEKNTNNAVLGKDDIPKQYTPKKVYWLNEKYLLAVIGFAYGTVDVGGDVYVIDIDTGNYDIYLKADENQQINDIYTVADKIVFLTVEFNEQEKKYIYGDEIIIKHDELLKFAFSLKKGKE